MAKSLCALAVLVLVSIGQPAAAQSLAQAAAAARKTAPVDPALRADIELLMDITGSSALSTQLANTVSDAFLNGFKETQTVVPPRMVEVVREVLNAEFSRAFNGPDIKDKQIALYAKYFTHQEVKGLLAFYQSDVGKKAIGVMPTLVREGAAIGEAWAKQSMPRVMQVLENRLKSEGLIP